MRETERGASDLDVHHAQLGHVGHEGFGDGSVLRVVEIGGQRIAIG